MKTTNTPAETLELACKLAEFLGERVTKICDLADSAIARIETGAVRMAQSPLALLGCEADGLAKDVQTLFEVLNRLPAFGTDAENG